VSTAALEALLDDGYTLDEAAAEIGLLPSEALALLRPSSGANGSGDPEAAGGPRGAGGRPTRPEAGGSRDFRRKPRTKGAVERERRVAEQRILAVPRGRRVELLAEAMATMRGEELSTHTPDARRKAYFTLADFALQALEMLLDGQRDPSPIARRERNL
jgi:hypothetical protein